MMLMMHKYSSIVCSLFVLGGILLMGLRGSDWSESSDFDDQLELATWMDSYQTTIDQAKKYVKERYPSLNCIPREWISIQLGTASWYTYTLESKQSGGCIQTMYVIDSSGRVEENNIDIKVERELFDQIIQNVADLMIDVKADPRIHFAPFIKRNEDNSISVWMLPGQEEIEGGDSLAFYGPEFHFKFDPSGSHVVEQDVIDRDLVWGVPLNRGKEIWLNYQKEDAITTGAMYFAWRYRNHFNRVFIETKKHITAIRYYDDGTYSLSEMTKKHKGDRYICFDPNRRG